MNKNRGMLLESIINRTIIYYESSNLALFHKKNLDVRFKKVEKTTNKLVEARVFKKSTVDYYGVYKGRYVAFEAKSVNENFLPLANIKSHQSKYLKMVHQFCGLSFYILFFKATQDFFVIFVEKLFDFKRKHLKIEDCEEIGFRLELLYPGILDFLPILDKKLETLKC